MEVSTLAPDGWPNGGGGAEIGSEVSYGLLVRALLSYTDAGAGGAVSTVASSWLVVSSFLPHFWQNVALAGLFVPQWMQYMVGPLLKS